MSFNKIDLKMNKEKFFYLAPDDLNKIFEHFKSKGYKVIGPTVVDDAIVYDEISGVKDLPVGVGDEQSPGNYRLKSRGDGAFFGYVVGPHSWKRFLYPPIITLFEARRENGSIKISECNDEDVKFLFVGVRACEISAIMILDKILSGGQYVDPIYLKRRKNTFIIAVNCNEPRGNCFCYSTGTGPRVLTGYDIVLTEVISQDRHYFTAGPGSESGEELLKELGFREATAYEIEEAEKVLSDAPNKFTKRVDLTDVVEILQSNYENPLWEKIAERCLSCGNCTMVCPTCFCHNVEDVTDLTGQVAKRVRRWDSCFTVEFSYIHGGSIRYSTMSRYRQWMMHKLSTWKNQFGMIGCVGCGRCITWCPVGIDITEGVRSFKEVLNKI
jgi:sulfhydrogenase subunit beta (sulfur reductase)